MTVNALKNRPEITPEISYLLDVNSNLNSFGGIAGYCAFYNINDVDERQYLQEMTQYISEQQNTE